MTTMEDLTKTQIILLTLLVSFVTSIATGIITTSLLAEAPASITQTINRVVEHTIEKVTPAPTVKGGVTTVKEVTVVSDEDAVTGSIAKASPSVVRLQEANTTGAANLYAIGIIVSKSGLVVTDKRDISTDLTFYTATLADGSTVRTRIIYKSDTDNLVVLALQTDATHKDFTPIGLSSGDLRLGQTVISIGGKDKNAIYIGHVVSVGTGTVLTDIPSTAETAGAPLINLSGDLVGLKTSNDDLTLSAGSYTTLTAIKKIISQAQ
ncbi:MAG: hypothetical protein JWL80_300 [Parcubacteria group bacterium]|nr:hypothetical protein [Parcubacteria group bacterium]